MNCICFYFDADNEKIAELLIKAGADVNAETDVGCSALHISAAHGTSKITDLLLKANANVSFSYRKCHGEPGYKAEKSGHLEIFKEALKKNGKTVRHGIIVDDLEDLVNAVREGKILEMNEKINDQNNFKIKFISE